MNSFTSRLPLITALAALMSGHAAVAQNVLPADARINGKQVWGAFESQRQVLQVSSAVIYTDEKSHVKSCYGVVVSAEGHVLTKASEIEGKSHLSMRIDKALYKDVKVVGVDPVWDVAMLKVESEQPFFPVVLSEDEDVDQGHWLISNGSASRSVRRVRLGISSAITREIKSKGSSVILGVQLSGTEDLAVQKVSAKSGAEKGGMKDGDVIQSLAGKKLKNRDDLLKSMQGKKPGEMVEIEVLRDKKTKKLKVELMARPGEQKVSRNDIMSGGTNSLSQRRDGFPRVLHHDTPLIKSSVGGPLLNIDGVCVGMNIARASRVATFAIPARELREMIEKMTD